MIIDSPIISGSTAATGSLNQVGNVVITGSLTVTGPISGALTGSVDSASFSQTSISASYASNAELLDGLNSTVFTQTGSFNTFSSSILSYTGSTNTRLNALESTSGSLNTASGSAITRLNALETASGSAITRLNSLETTTGSLNTASGSAITRLGNLETASGSAITRLNALESTTGSLNTASGSAITRLNSLESNTGSYATTGSNTFVSSQYISNTINPTGFTTTASLYTDGGLRVTKDAYVSGTLYLNNVTVYGTQSVNYITSSQLDISDNIINVNTATPNVRFGGLAVYDSGSTSLTGSMLWDSQNNNWIYSNPSGSGNYDSSMVIMGPRNASTLGNEQGLNCNYLVQGQGSHHTTSSMIYNDSAMTCIPGIIIGGSDIVLSSANPFVYGGTAVGGAGISNNTGASYIKIYGASHATTPNVTAFVNASSTTLTISNTGDTYFANNVCALNLVSRCNIRVGVNGGYAVVSGPTTGAAISLGSNSATFDRNLSLGLVDGSLAFNPILTINAQTANVGIGMCTPDRRLYITDTSVTQGTFLAYNQCSTFCGTVIEGITDRTSNSAFNLMNLKSSTTSMFIVRGDGNVGIGTTSPATLLANTSTRPANADGLSIHLSGLDWVVNGQGYAGTIWNTSATANNYNAGLLVRICSTDVTDRILDLESGGINKFRMLGTGVATFTCQVNAESFYTNDTRYISNQIMSGYNANSEDSDIWINYTGYLGGTTRFRDFRVGNGKQGQIALFDGSTGAATFTCSVTANGGNILSSGASYGIVQVKGSGASTWQMFANPSDEMRFGISGVGDFMTIKNSGNVGIGTTTPTGTYGKLSVAGGISILNDNNAKLEIGRYNGSVSNAYIKLGANANSLIITNNTDAADIFTITNCGNVGIGTTSPSGVGILLNAKGITGNTVSMVIAESADAGSMVSLYSGASSGDHPSLIYLRDLRFGSGNKDTTCYAERMRITSGGNVGIGTASPNASSPLHIKMCSNSNGDGIRIQAICSGASGSQPGIAFANVSDAKRYSISLDNTGDILQITNAAGANTLQINQSSVACFASQTCAPMFISTAGCMASNGIITYSVGGTMQGITSTYFDFPTWDDAGQGQMFEIKAFFDHFYNWNYGTHYYVFLTAREGNTQALTMFSCGTANGGSWMSYKTSSTNLRVCKIAGSYIGGGAYWIQVTAKQP